MDASADTLGGSGRGALPRVLPPEILQRVLSEYSPLRRSFAILAPQDLKAACLVSKSFQVMAERVLYRHIRVTCHPLWDSDHNRNKLATLPNISSVLLSENVDDNTRSRRARYVRNIELYHLRYAKADTLVLDSYNSR